MEGGRWENKGGEGGMTRAGNSISNIKRKKGKGVMGRKLR